MKFDHVVNHNGVYYKAGEEVPVEEPSISPAELPFYEAPDALTREELERLSVRELKALAAEKGIEIKKTAKAADIITEVLAKQ